MKSLLLLAMLSLSPLSWDGSLWKEMSTESRISYVAGFEAGLATAAMFTNELWLMIPETITLDFIVLDLGLFYLNPFYANVLIPDAILTRSGMGGR